MLRERERDGPAVPLTPLGEKRVWADHRIHARLKPVLESLASELSAEIAQVKAAQPAVLRLQAPHGFAIERLVEALGRAGVSVEHRYGSSPEAVAALHDGACDVAGLHIPLGWAQEAALAHYRRWLAADDLVVVDIATCRQGLAGRQRCRRRRCNRCWACCAATPFAPRWMHCRATARPTSAA